jgi:hypothetical protein
VTAGELAVLAVLELLELLELEHAAATNTTATMHNADRRMPFIVPLLPPQATTTEHVARSPSLGSPYGCNSIGLRTSGPNGSDPDRTGPVHPLVRSTPKAQREAER